ncbi:hypothetical protein [uncultured Akkermansia sp.]|nr:hypothetical protein [uncultured Akkermansia sp.]
MQEQKINNECFNGGDNAHNGG